MKDLNLTDLVDILEIHFYNTDGMITLVMKQPTLVGFIEELLRRTDKHDLVHVERNGQIIVVSEYYEDFDSYYD